MNHLHSALRRPRNSNNSTAKDRMYLPHSLMDMALALDQCNSGLKAVISLHLLLLRNNNSEDHHSNNHFGHQGRLEHTSGNNNLILRHHRHLSDQTHMAKVARLLLLITNNARHMATLSDLHTAKMVHRNNDSTNMVALETVIVIAIVVFVIN